jgi:hypothetical protein
VRTAAADLPCSAATAAAVAESTGSAPVSGRLAGVRAQPSPSTSRHADAMRRRAAVWRWLNRTARTGEGRILRMGRQGSKQYSGGSANESAERKGAS